MKMTKGEENKKSRRFPIAWKASWLGIGAALSGVLAFLIWSPDSPFAGGKAFPEVKVGKNPPNRINPTHGFVYVLDVQTTTNGDLDFYYSKKFEKELTSSGLNAKRGEFKAWLKTIVKRTDLGTGRLTKRCRIGNERPGGKTCTKPDTSLSISHQHPAFLAVVLNPAKKWSFVNENNPAYDEEVLTLFDDPSTKHFGELWKINRAADDPVRQDNELKDAIGAYLLVDGSKLRSDSGDDYVSQFNLYTVIKDVDDQDIPIVIDPDVRWPGGND